MGKCRCPEAEIITTDWRERFRAAMCVCNNNARLHAEENGRKITVCGDEFANIDKVKVDGGLIDSGATSKCDYFFGHKVNEVGNYANNVFVELKGCDVGKAYDQIVASVTVFKTNKILTNNSIVNGVIVCSHIPKSGGRALKAKIDFKRYTGGTLHIKENVLTYDIAENRIAN